jgi:hypothetical protein
MTHNAESVCSCGYEAAPDDPCPQCDGTVSFREQSAESVRERSRLYRQVVVFLGYGDNARTEWFNPPEEGRLVHVEWDREVAVLTWMITEYPLHNDG